TLAVAAPRGERPLALHAAAHVLSGNPPRPEVKYRIDISTDGGKTWGPVVKDWTIPRRGDEPADFWSQSLCWGSCRLGEDAKGTILVRFRNDGGKSYARAEAHLVYAAGGGSTKVTFAWADEGGERRASAVFAPGGD